MTTEACKKINIGESLGIKIVFCEDCNVVELEIGAVSVRLCPDVIQQVANVMMKASLQLDQLSLKNKALKNKASVQQKMQPAPRKMIH